MSEHWYIRRVRRAIERWAGALERELTLTEEQVKQANGLHVKFLDLTDEQKKALEEYEKLKPVAVTK